MRVSSSSLPRVGAAVLALIAGACGQIISADFDDLQLSEDASAGSGGSGGGARGSGGSTGGSGGASGTRGSGGTSGSVGADGAGGAAATGGGGSGGSSGVSDGGAGKQGTGGSEDGSAGTGGAAGTMGSAGAAGEAATAPGCHQDAGLGPVVINEIDADRDFVELYNTGSAACDLAGFKVADAVGVNSAPKIPEALVFPPNSLIAAHGFVLVIANQPNPGGPITCLSTVFPCYTATYGISAAGERIYFLNSLNATLDTSDWPDPLNDGGVPTGQTVGRLPDGTGGFTFTRATPGLPNQAP